jgi:hypothetical protein
MADDRIQFAREVGLRVEDFAPLLERMNADFRVETWGYDQFARLGDVRVRAIVSDHLLSATEAVLTNLLGTRVAEMDFNEMTGSGIEYTRDFTAEDVREDSVTVEFFRAFGSTLDCIAGVAIGVLRIPRSIIKASVNRDLFDLDPDTAPDDATKNAWRLFRTKLDELRAGAPNGWMDWALLYRNAAVHRPRQINTMLPRAPTTNLILPESSIHTLLKYDIYLRRRPWLPELEHLAAERPIEDLYLNETATQTMRGLMERLNETSETLSRELLKAWDAQGAGTLTLATPKWTLDPEPDIDFAGFAPDPKATGTEIRTHPATATRLELAERLRQHERERR